MQLLEFWNFYKDRVSHEVGGWFYNHDVLMFWLLDFIQKQAEWRGDLCELGVFEGKSAIALGTFARQDEWLFCFDIFHEVPSSVVESNIQRFCPDLNGKLTCITRDLPSMRTPPPEVAPNTLRFLHLDAVHDHPGVLNDLRNFAPLLTREAIIVLDDYFDPEWPGVPSAMTEFCLSEMGRHIRPFAASKSKMYLCARPYVEAYQRCIVASGQIEKLSFERVLDVSVLRCFTAFPAPREDLLRALVTGGNAA